MEIGLSSPALPHFPKKFLLKAMNICRTDHPHTTVAYLQSYVADKPTMGGADHYMLKLMEEVGELAKAVGKDRRRTDGVKVTIDEELWDVIYYCVRLANYYGVDLEKTIRDKEEINKAKYGFDADFEPGR